MELQSHGTDGPPAFHPEALRRGPAHERTERSPTPLHMRPNPVAFTAPWRRCHAHPSFAFQRVGDPIRRARIEAEAPVRTCR